MSTHVVTKLSKCSLAPSALEAGFQFQSHDGHYVLGEIFDSNLECDKLHTVLSGSPREV